MLYSCQLTCHQNSGYHITNTHKDGEFTPLQAMIYDNNPGRPRTNITSANEHIPNIECRIRVVKETKRAVWYRLPFNKTPSIFTIYIIFTVLRMLNHFPAEGGVSSILSNKTIMFGDTIHTNNTYGWILDIIAKCISMKILRKVNHHVPKAPFALDPVEMNRDYSDLWVLTWKKIHQQELVQHPNAWHCHRPRQRAILQSYNSVHPHITQRLSYWTHWYHRSW